MTTLPRLTTPKDTTRLTAALPFWMSLGLIPIAWIGAVFGGWTVLLLPIAAWYLISIVDYFTGLNEDNADPETPVADLFWYRLITVIWAPVQFLNLFALIWFVTGTSHLSLLSEWVLFIGIGIVSGTIGIVYSHELMHQQPRWERALGDWLLAMALYSHFRSEHLLVHHRYVGTPRDAVTARYNEGFHRFFFRVLRDSAVSAFRAEQALLARKGKPWHARQNPFWRYWALQLAMLALALWVGGPWGLVLFVTQALVAVWQLELVDYMEHYGLTRRHLGGGKYEHVHPRHSWNSALKASNWLLINLQRHSDHHYKPDRRFPLLQTYQADEAPQLPFGYPIMGMAALVPPIWRRVMNPRVRAWREQFYPDITDWTEYNRGTTPMPR